MSVYREPSKPPCEVCETRARTETWRSRVRKRLDLPLRTAAVAIGMAVFLATAVHAGLALSSCEPDWARCEAACLGEHATDNGMVRAGRCFCDTDGSRENDSASWVEVEMQP